MARLFITKPAYAGWRVAPEAGHRVPGPSMARLFITKPAYAGWRVAPEAAQASFAPLARPFTGRALVPDFLY
ncbi:MAG: hypothetical protein MUD01_20270 [Chloroflexaceae bacterium]|nr:hypothetical protein [Chloroflexaceae bacterium]